MSNSAVVIINEVVTREIWGVSIWAWVSVPTRDQSDRNIERLEFSDWNEEFGDHYQWDESYRPKSKPYKGKMISIKVSDPTMGKEASPVEHGCEGEDGECKECQAKKCITGCAQTFRCWCWRNSGQFQSFLALEFANLNSILIVVQGGNGGEPKSKGGQRGARWGESESEVIVRL